MIRDVAAAGAAAMVKGSVAVAACGDELESATETANE
jgi:hypothetical protein